MVVKSTWILETMRDFLMLPLIETTTLQLAKYTRVWLTRKDAVTTWGKQFKVQLHILHAQSSSLSLLHFLFMLLPLSTSIFFCSCSSCNRCHPRLGPTGGFSTCRKKNQGWCLYYWGKNVVLLYSKKWWPTPGLFHSSASIKNCLKSLLCHSQIKSLSRGHAPKYYFFT